MAPLRVEVVYALPERALTVTVRLAQGATAGDAVRAARLPGIAPGECRLGIFGEEVAPETQVRDGDRVEIYRPLRMDPKEARRRRARAKR